LVEQWPHGNPPNALAWIDAIGREFEKYPLPIVEECVIELPRVREFPPTIACVAEWCQARLKFYETLAACPADWTPPSRQIEFEPSPEERERAGKLMADLVASLRTKATVIAPSSESLTQIVKRKGWATQGEPT
jgi:hypothetical protein